MKFITSLFFTFSLSVYASAPQDHWAQTQLSFEQILTGQIFSQQSCQMDIHVFTACVMTMNGSLNLKDSKFKHYLYPDANSGGEYKGFKTVKYRFDDSKLADIHKKYLASMSVLYKQFIDQNKMSRQLVFDMAYQQMKKDSKASGQEAYQAGLLTNTLLSYVYDPFTKITPVTSFYDYSESKGAYGLKFSVAVLDGVQRMVVSHVYKNSPAEKIGLRKGDILIDVEREVRLEEMMQILSERNEISITYRRSGVEKEAKLKRSLVEFPNVISEKFKVGQNSFGMIKLDSFNNPRTCQDFLTHAESLIKKDGVKGLVIDLRDNGGGMVQELICITSKFLEAESVTWVIQDLESGRYQVQRKNKEAPRYRIPTVVLVNAASASASEAFPLYMKAYRKAWVVGERTFGKGTMQSSGQIHPKLVLAQTVAKYYGPNGISPQIQGVVPDFKVYPSYSQKVDSPALRITDTFDIVVPHTEVSEPEMKDRQEQKKKINACLKSSGRVDERFAKLSTTAELAQDYQLEKSLEILECHLKLKIPEFKSTEIPVAKLK